MVAAERHYRSNRWIQHELHIGDKEFDVDQRVSAYMIQGNVYSVYYVEKVNGHDDEILSLEWVARAS